MDHPPFIAFANLYALYCLIKGVYKSQRRLLSVGYAILAFGVVVVLGMVATFLLMPARGTVVDVNATLDMVGDAIQIAAPFAAAFAANIPPRRI